MAVTAHNSKEAITNFRVLKRFKNNTLIECILETGRTHQIRVHMSHIGHPLLGDTLYGHESKLIDRQALHAYKLSFIHPVSQEKVLYKAEPPKDIYGLIK